MSSAIELYARETPGHAERVAHAVAMLQSAASAHAGRIVLASSLGAEDMVLTDLIARHQLPIAIGTLETGKLHAQTLALVQRTEQRYGVQIELHRPRDEAVVHFVRTPRRRCDVSLGRAAQGLLRTAQARTAGAHVGQAQRLDHRPAARTVGRPRPTCRFPSSMTRGAPS